GGAARPPARPRPPRTPPPPPPPPPRLTPPQRIVSQLPPQQPDLSGVQHLVLAAPHHTLPPRRAEVVRLQQRRQVEAGRIDVGQFDQHALEDAVEGGSQLRRGWIAPLVVGPRPGLASEHGQILV